MLFIQIPLFVIALYVITRQRKKGLFYKNYDQKDNFIDISSINENNDSHNNHGYCFTGLRNLGNTCYMNSILQSLYASEIYRSKIIKTKFKENSVGQELKNLFIDLKEQNENISTKPLVQILDINIRVQEDAEEFLLNLINKVDDSILLLNGNTDTSEDTTTTTNGYKDLKKLPSNSIKFKTEQIIQCIHVDQMKRKQQTNIDLSLDFYGSKNLTHAISRYFIPELLSGENQYRTAQYGLQDAEKSVLLKTTPDVLIIHLKRFEFDSDTFEMRKIRDSIDIPFSFIMSTSPNKTSILDCSTNTKLSHTSYNIIRNTSSNRHLSEYCTNNISHNINMNTQQYLYSNNITHTDVINNDTVIYELNSAVIHQGMINSGHYYSLCRKHKEISKRINNKNGISNTPWMKLNDHIVSEIDEVAAIKEMKGDTSSSSEATNRMKGGSSTNAYILFYEKRK